ncbi:MAG: TetR/AcrR family transcriptional regulator [Clostridia bacterium]
MSRRTTEAKDITRNTILAVAKELFLHQGINNTTMTQISDRVGISPRTIYRYFEHKDVLAAAIAVEQRSKLEDNKHALSLTTGSGYDRIKNHLDFLLKYQFLSSTLNISNFLIEYHYYLNSVSNPKPIPEENAKLSKEYMNLIMSFLELGQEDGSISKEIDAQKSSEMFFAAYLNLVHKIAAHYKNTDNDNDNKPEITLLQTFFEHYLRSIKS